MLLLAAAFVLWRVTGPVAQDPQYHQFVDQRAIWGLSHAANVLSNLPFLAAAIVGLIVLNRRRDRVHAVFPIYKVFFAGLFLTGLGSGSYHLFPDSQTLLWDRLPMTICFAAFTAVVVAERISLAIGRKLFPWLLCLGVASVLYWYWLDDLRPYLVVQFGPMLALPFVLWRCAGPGTVWLWLTLGFYLLAKGAELLDATIFELTQGIVSGHTLKHLAAAAGAFMVISKVAQAGRRRRLPAISDYCRFGLLVPVDAVVRLFAKGYTSFLFLLKQVGPKMLDRLSRALAVRAYWRARRRVPGYRQFLDDKAITAWDEVPVTDKALYIRRFSVSERCRGGTLPAVRTLIDESSGSTGLPGNWVRSDRERREAQRFVSHFATFCYGRESRLIVNAFSMGAWATGLNVGTALERNGLVKNTGPDIDKIFHTLEVFGTGYRYLVAGYPPFLKRIVDEARTREFAFDRYRVDALAGGEGMSEELRDYLLRQYGRVYSGYGATDLEIGIGGETPMTVALRRLARDNPEIRRALFGNDSRLPMVFQYNPMTHYIEVNDAGELLFTITRGSILSPRIRYNLHDQGGIARYDEVWSILRPFGVELDRLNTGDRGRGRGLRLPLLWVFGRSDYTLSIMGANLYPENLEQCIYGDPLLSQITLSFCQSLREDGEGGVRPAFYFEITESPSMELEQRYSSVIMETLPRINADFRKAHEEYPEALMPSILLYSEGEGPFARDKNRIKQTRLLSLRRTTEND
jgi:phenylacetate-CoA ligase